jgi:hypothetical protein
VFLVRKRGAEINEYERCKEMFRRTAETIAGLNAMEMEVSDMNPLLLLVDAGASVPGRVKQCIR